LDSDPPQRAIEWLAMAKRQDTGSGLRVRGEPGGDTQAPLGRWDGHRIAMASMDAMDVVERGFS
jgi:hypothetical protein